MSGKDIEWLFNLKEKVSNFLYKLKGKKRAGFYHYSLSGDYFGEKIKWGLGNSVFFLKIIYTLNLENDFKEEINESVAFINSFQKKTGYYYDPLVRLLSFPLRWKTAILSRNFSNFFNKMTIQGETRQAISSLIMLHKKPKYYVIDLPNNQNRVTKFLAELNWKHPWGAGAHFSYLIFMLKNSNLKNKEELIQFAINWVNQLQHPENGFWYEGEPTLRQKINGAMKIITGLNAANKLNINYEKQIIDNSLLARNDITACDNFNLTYVLKYCSEVSNFNYRSEEIEDFIYNKLKIYKKFYYPKIGGFSFYENRSNRVYYNALLTRGKNEPDIHGTVMYLWGISLISQVLHFNDELKFNEFIT